MFFHIPSGNVHQNLYQACTRKKLWQSNCTHYQHAPLDFEPEFDCAALLCSAMSLIILLYLLEIMYQTLVFCWYMPLGVFCGLISPETALLQESYSRSSFELDDCLINASITASHYLCLSGSCLLEKTKIIITEK